MKLNFWTAVTGGAASVAGIAIIVDTYASNGLEIPDWLWYTLGASLLLVGGGVIAGIVTVGKAA